MRFLSCLCGIVVYNVEKSQVVTLVTFVIFFSLSVEISVCEFLRIHILFIPEFLKIALQ